MGQKIKELITRMCTNGFDIAPNYSRKTKSSST